MGIFNDHLNVEHNVDDSKPFNFHPLLESFSGIRVPENKPLIGENVYTQTCGVHADGDSKSNLYFNDLMPERFGRTRKYALGKTSGKANIKKNLEELGLDLDLEATKKVTQRIIELGDKKETVTTEDLPYIISDVLQGTDLHQPIKVKSYTLTLANGMRPIANIIMEINGENYEESSIGDGQYDAFMKSLWKIYTEQLGRERPILRDYVVTIPPGGKTDALVEAVITWEFKEREFKTKAVEADQTEAAIKATEKMLNIIERNHFK